MKILSAEFVTSIATGGHLPVGSLATVAWVGRSNVGKSSLINALVGRRVARSGSTPGTTRLANVYQVRLSARTPGTRALTLVDLPGYGYARGGETARRAFDEVTQTVFDELTGPWPDGGAARRAHLVGVVLVLDARHPGLDADRAAHAWVRELAAPIITVATKIDRISSRSEQRQVAHTHATALGLDGPVIATSSKTREGVDRLWKVLIDLL